MERAAPPIRTTLCERVLVMWTCPKCSEDIDDEFDVCWNCGTDTEGNVDPEFETADAPNDEPIVVEAWDTERLRSSPLTISNVNYGAGGIFTAFIVALLLSALLVGICTIVSVDPPALKLVLLLVLGVGAILSLVRCVWAISATVLRIELGDRLVVQRFLGVSEHQMSEIVSVEFEKELKAGFTSLFRGLRRLVTFVLADGQRLRVHIDDSVESQIRDLLKRTDIT